MACRAISPRYRFVGLPVVPFGRTDIVALHTGFHRGNPEHGEVLTTVGEMTVQARAFFGRAVKAAALGQDQQVLMAPIAQGVPRLIQEGVLFRKMGIMAFQALAAGHHVVGIVRGNLHLDLEVAVHAEVARFIDQ